MASTLSPARPDYHDDRYADEAPVAADLRTFNVERTNDWPRPPLRKRSSHPFIRFLIAVGIGIAGTLAWQPYGDAARGLIADSSPVLGWLAPQARPLPQAADQVAPTAPATPSPDLQQVKAALTDLAAMRQSVEQLAAQQQQMAGDIVTMQAAQQTILRKVSTPPSPPPRQVAPPPAHNPVPN